WRAGTDAPASAGFRLAGAHTDSPNLRLKARPDRAVEGYRQWGVEIYGGVLLATWADRDLGLSGRVALRGEDGQVTSRLYRCDRPIARIPNVAIHLNREVNTKGLILDQQKHLPPVLGTGEGRELRAWLAGELGCEPGDLLAWELGLHDVVPPTVGGIDGDFVFAPRLDNQGCCYAGLMALLAARP
ncbi:MAG: M18 family aminopeptidase, partial [Myxococcales bacterium]|nr:M18 family aminopeptidase [Myxococcales bacterium]